MYFNPFQISYYYPHYVYVRVSETWIAFLLGNTLFFVIRYYLDRIETSEDNGTTQEIKQNDAERCSTLMYGDVVKALGMYICMYYCTYNQYLD